LVGYEGTCDDGGVKALPTRAESLVNAQGEPSRSSEGPPDQPGVEPIDFDGTATLSDSALRMRVGESNAPGVRLAACWRLMLRNQALPQRSPGEGIRRLILINLATQQDLELLEVLLCLDPDGGVRAQTAILLWRVARDRDRVVGLLVSRLQEDASPEVLRQLLTLEPALPFERTQSMARSYLSHPSVEVRREGWSYWIRSGGPIDERVADLVWREPSRDLRAWCLLRWAERPDYSVILRNAPGHPAAMRDALDALFQARRCFRVADLSPLLDDCEVEAVLRIARGPFDASERRLLISLTGLTDRDGSKRRTAAPLWIGEQLWRCLRSAYSVDELPLTSEEIAWTAFLEERIKAFETDGSSVDGEMDMDSEWEVDDMRELLGLLNTQGRALATDE
jgi:hypothetical protein